MNLRKKRTLATLLAIALSTTPIIASVDTNSAAYVNEAQERQHLVQLISELESLSYFEGQEYIQSLSTEEVRQLYQFLFNRRIEIASARPF